MSITHKPQAMTLSGNRQLDFRKPLVMGILNATPDSFSDPGRFFKFEDGIRRAHDIIDEGADIIDIGGESSRPGAQPVDADTESDRVIPLIDAIREFSDIPISIDTTKAIVAQKAIDAGADIINDISAFRFDAGMVHVAAGANVPAVLMHMLGTPKNMQENPSYEDCIEEIKCFFREQIDFCISGGMDRDRLILDPGIGFGKRPQDNLTIIKNLGEFKSFGYPIMVGASRKSFIPSVSGITNAADKRIGGSLASMIISVYNGCSIVRVHDVAETVEALRILRAIEESI